MMNTLKEKASEIRNAKLTSILHAQWDKSKETVVKVPLEITQETTQNKDAWKAEIQPLIEWFLTAELPSQPFQLCQGIFIANPTKYYTYLKENIAEGSGGCRAKTGALQSDLEKLKGVINNTSNTSF